MPGYVARDRSAGDVGLLAIDHIVGNVELGEMETWVKFYEDVFGMTEMLHFTDEAISTEYSALMSKVVTSGNGRVKFPINEPGRGQAQVADRRVPRVLRRRRGAAHRGRHARHRAHGDRDARARDRVPARAGDVLRRRPERIGEIKESLEDLRRLGILVDRDDEGYMLQIFTKPIGDRPTMFLEVIERHGARGFGEGNFKALFEAIEREQELRGNL